MERSTDGDISANRHDHGQPGTAEEEYVDERFFVRRVVEHHQGVLGRVEDLVLDEGQKEVEQTEEEIGHGECHQTTVVRSFHTLHRALQLLVRKDDQVENVAGDAEQADRRNYVIIDDVSNLAVVTAVVIVIALVGIKNLSHVMQIFAAF